MHRRVAEVLRDKFADAAVAEPELLAHHFTQAGLTEAAIEWWGRAGQRSLERSALVEAAAQLTRALDQIETLPATPALRREQIKLQVALITPIIHIKGYAAPETKAAAERARLLIEQAEALGEPAEDPLLLFSVLYGFWVANYVAFNGDAMRNFAGQFLALALYDPRAHRPLATRFGQDHRVSVLAFRSLALWLLGYPESALADSDQALRDAREIGQAATLMFALLIASLYTHVPCGNFAIASAELDELDALADEKGTLFWKVGGIPVRGCVFALTGKASDAVHVLTSGITAFRSTGATVWMPFFLSCLARAHSDLGKFDDAWRCIGEAMTAIETTKERWCEAEVNRMAGDIALMAAEPDAAKAEAYFDRALALAREQQAKSWELRAAMSMARLWRDQGKRDEARDLLAPVYSWFTEGFDTLDLKEAEALLKALAA